MFLIYLWQTSNIGSVEAREKFSRILKKQRELYHFAWGRIPELDIHQQGSVLIGQLRYDTRVTGWSPWIDHGDIGLIWNGVCENYLGVKFEHTEVAKVLKILHDRPQDICNWDGRFCSVAWDQKTGKVSLTTGATESPSLWSTEGPHGWAIGSHANLLLDMVGGKKSPSLSDIQLYMAYGYLVGCGSLFKNVDRLGSRRQVIFDGISKPKIRTYASLIDYLQPEQQIPDRKELLQIAAQRIVGRVKKQLQYSANPWVLLTGGRDSRCIAAAAKHNDFSGPVHTGGPPESADVRIAGQVADRLRLRWQYDPGNSSGSPMASLANSVEKLRLWTQMSEGIETLRHAVPFQAFFKRKLPIPEVRHPLFHGACVSGRGGYYWNTNIAVSRLNKPNSPLARKIILNRMINYFTPKNKKIRQGLESSFSLLDRDIQDIASVAQWLDIFYWQNRSLHWAEDMMTVKEPMYWHWKPFVDRILIQIYWNLDPQEIITESFWDDIVITVAPELHDIPYDYNALSIPGLLKRISGSLRSRIRSQIEKYRPILKYRQLKKSLTASADPYLRQFWETILFSKQPHIWEEIIDKAALRSIMHKQPRAEILWNAATVDLFATTHC